MLSKIVNNLMNLKKHFEISSNSMTTSPAGVLVGDVDVEHDDSVGTMSTIACLPDDMLFKILDQLPSTSDRLKFVILYISQHL